MWLRGLSSVVEGAFYFSHFTVFQICFDSQAFRCPFAHRVERFRSELQLWLPTFRKCLGILFCIDKGAPNFQHCTSPPLAIDFSSSKWWGLSSILPVDKGGVILLTRLLRLMGLLVYGCGVLSWDDFSSWCGWYLSCYRM